MKTKTYHIVTFGCKANTADSERIAGFLESLNFQNAVNEKNADVIIYNTCSVRQTAEDRIFGLNKKLRVLKEKNPELKIILSGCMTHYKEKELKKRLPYIDAFLQNNDLKKIGDLFFENHFKKLLTFAPKYESSFRAQVSVSSGCDNFCSYCIVPYARGREVCLPAEDIINEVQRLVQNNYKEIWLLGQNVNSYKSQIHPHTKFWYGGKNPKLLKNQNYVRFSDLLKTVDAIPGKFWLRFTSPHPKNFSDDLIKTLTECEKFPRHINLPSQSGDNEILKKMNRSYTREEYIKLVEKLRKAMPDIALSTDTIVGFPGETKKQFLNTVKLYKKIKFDMAYISEYSPRPKTLAAKLYKDNISKKEKAERKKLLTAALSEITLLKNKKLIGKKILVLVDGQKNGRAFGRSEENKVVELINETDNIKIGEFVKVKILSASPWKLKGLAIDNLQ